MSQMLQMYMSGLGCSILQTFKNFKGQYSV